jgi:hypothetical protein
MEEPCAEQAVRAARTLMEKLYAEQQAMSANRDADRAAVPSVMIER